MSTDEAPRHVVAVIQARMGSTRMPGKVLRPVVGMPLLWHVVHRLKKSQLIDTIVVATSDNPKDNEIVTFCREYGVDVVRGSETNVLSRFAKAAENFDADIIVRVCSDSPFIEGSYIDHFISALIAQNCDYVLPDETKPNAHQGIDVFTRRALDKLLKNAADDPVACEHVTGYFKLHPGFVPVAKADPYPESDRASGRLSVDTPDDVAFVEAVYARLHAKAGEASLADLLFLLEREPALSHINGHVRQKEIAQAAAVALIRCDGGDTYGMGHVKRMVQLARALRDREGIGVVFAINGSEEALVPVRRAGFEATLLEKPDSPLEGIAQAADILVVDCRQGPTSQDLAKMSDKIPLIAVVDDISDRRLAADRAYYPPVPQVDALSWSGSHCMVRAGWQWALLGASFPSASADRPRPASALPSLLIAMGGSDPFGLTLRAAYALRRLDPVFRARFILGPGMKNRDAVAREIVALGSNFETIEGADDLVTEYAAADMALAAFGVTAYELAATGVPAVYIGISPDHARSASAFEAAGMGVSLGVMSEISDQKIADGVWQLMHDPLRRRQMRAAGLLNIDGLGAHRIAADLAEALADLRGGQVAGQSCA